MKMLAKTLEAVSRPGEFCSSGYASFCFPYLDIKKVGEIAFPLIEEQAKKIISVAHPAPYGKGTRTIVDQSVRNVWELDCDQFTLGNDEWNSYIEAIKEDVLYKLGLGEHKVRSDLYKLLLYEKDSFFLSHQDTEKEDGMFATLSITLPSAHTGGELIVEHDGRSEIIHFDEKSKLHSIQYAAFYADCKHEIKPLKKGYRLTLIYNLSFEGKSEITSAPENGALISEATERLEALRKKGKEKIVIPLEHQYTEKNLSFHTLKNLDRATADVMVKAAEAAGFKIYLSFIVLWESGLPVDDYDSYSYRNRRSRYSYDDEDDENISSNTKYEMEEIYDSAVYADYWITEEGNTREFGRIDFSEDTFVNPIDFHSLKPYSQEYEGYMGNYGPDLDQWYRNTALILWPMENHYELLMKTGQKVAIPELEDQISVINSSKKKLAEATKFVKAIIDGWQFDQYHDHESPWEGRMLELLEKINQPKLAQTLIKKIWVKNVTGMEYNAVIYAADKWGWNAFTVLSDVPKTIPFCRFGAMVTLLEHLCSYSKTEEKENVLKKILLAVVNRLQKERKIEESEFILQGILEALFNITKYLEDDDTMITLIDGCLKRYTTWSFDDVLLPVALDLSNNSKINKCESFLHFSGKVVEKLNKLTSKKLTPPEDWKMTDKVNCSCDDCKELQEFLLNPIEQVHRFRIRKDRRQHLHQQITWGKLHMTHVTERKGSPQTLVCTKTRGAYEILVKQQTYHRNSLKDLHKHLNT